MTRYRVDVDGKELEVRVVDRTGASVTFDVAGSRYRVTVAPAALPAGPDAARGDRAAHLPAAPRHTSSGPDPSLVVSPIPGTVTKVLVAVGDVVGPGTPVCAVEAMKMENLVPAGAAGRVEEVCVSPGERVEGDQPLVRLGKTN